MKRIALLCIVCLSVALPAAAQIAWEVGVKGGVGLAKLTGDTETTETDGTLTVTLNVDQYRTGFSGGGFATARITADFGIRLEALFSQKGGTGDFSVSDGTTTVTGNAEFKFDYFEVPLLAVGTFGAGTKTRIDVFGGPVFGFKTGANLRLEAEGQSDETDIGDSIKGTDFGFTAGAGLTFLTHPKANIVIDARYVRGLTNIPEDAPEDFDLKNNDIVFMAGLSFPLGGGSAPAPATSTP
jgi:opacity protein-like surface antigen